MRVPASNPLRCVGDEAGEMTQQLAQQGVTQQTVIAMEGGKYAPSLEPAFKLAAALGRPPEQD